MKKVIFISVILLFLFNCKKNKVEKEGKTWVYIEISFKGKEVDDVIYGEIDLEDLKLIEQNSTSEKLIKVSEGRFIDKDSLVKKVSDGGNEKGTIFYRIKNIVEKLRSLY